jgi:hypothetical protein
MWDVWWAEWRLGRFSAALRFPLPILILLTAPRSYIIIIIRTGTIDSVVADKPSGLREKKAMATVLFFRHGWNKEIAILGVIINVVPTLMESHCACVPTL